MLTVTDKFNGLMAIAYFNPDSHENLVKNFWNCNDNDQIHILNAISVVVHYSMPMRSTNAFANANYQGHISSQEFTPIVETPVPIVDAQMPVYEPEFIQEPIVVPETPVPTKTEKPRKKKTGFIPQQNNEEIKKLPRTEEEMTRILSPLTIKNDETENIEKKTITQLINTIVDNCEIHMPPPLDRAPNNAEIESNSSYAAIASSSPKTEPVKVLIQNPLITPEQIFVEQLYEEFIAAGGAKSPIINIIRAMGKINIDKSPDEIEIIEGPGKYCKSNEVIVRYYVDPYNFDSNGDSLIKMQEIGTDLVKVFADAVEHDLEIVRHEKILYNGTLAQYYYENDGKLIIKESAHKSIYHLLQTLMTASFNGTPIKELIENYNATAAEPFTDLLTYYADIQNLVDVVAEIYKKRTYASNFIPGGRTIDVSRKRY